jgi:hypothetical protein
MYKRIVRAGANSVRIYTAYDSALGVADATSFGGRACFIFYHDADNPTATKLGDPPLNPLCVRPPATLAEIMANVKEELGHIVTGQGTHPLSWSAAWRKTYEELAEEEKERKGDDTRKYEFKQRITSNRLKRLQLAALFKDQGVKTVKGPDLDGAKIDSTDWIMIPPEWQWADEIDSQAKRILKKDGRDAADEFVGLALAEHPKERLNYARFQIFEKTLRLGRDCRSEYLSYFPTPKGFSDNYDWSFDDNHDGEPPLERTG